MREYVVLKEHKKAHETDTHLTVAGVVKAHDQEAAIMAIHQAEVLPPDQNASSQPAYRAIPLSFYEPLVRIKTQRITKIVLERSSKSTRAKSRPRQSPALPLEAGPIVPVIPQTTPLSDPSPVDVVPAGVTS